MQTHPKTLYQFGPFEVNPDSGELLKNGRHVSLQDQPFRLLVVLLESAGEIVSREELRSRIWPEDTFVDFDGSLRVAVRKLREALGDNAENPRYIETIPKRGYRFLGSAVRPSEAIPSTVAAPVDTPPTPTTGARLGRWTVVAISLLLVIIFGAGAWFHLRSGRKVLTERDTVVLADFKNSTGDPVFDATLRQGLAVQLEQSPFLSLVSDERIHQMLGLMGQPADARLTPDIAQTLCRRTQSAAVIMGSIASLGTEYVVGLRAVGCGTGDTLGEEQTQATGKEQVLTALDNAAAALRERLGESLSSVQRFDKPLPELTTPSLDALQAFALGWETANRGDFVRAAPFFQRAIDFDPNFAMAYAALGAMYEGMDETDLARQNVSHAYELRSRVSEPEKFTIESKYYHAVTGDLEKARQVEEFEAQTHPRNPGPHGLLWLLDSQVGQLKEGLAQIQEALRLDSRNISCYGQLVAAYTYLDRLEEARAAAQQALKDHFDSFPLRIQMYRLAFLANDTAGMARQVEWAKGKPGSEDELLAQESDTAAYSGKLKASRELWRQTVESSIRTGKKEKSTYFELRGAMNEALVGDVEQARARVQSALHGPAPREAQYVAALTLALAGDTARAQRMADDLATRFPEDTIVQFEYLPTVYAQIAINRGEAAKAIEVLRTTRPYELAAITVPLYMGPVYVRGNAYLATHQGAEAAREFQEIADHRGVVRNHIVGALTHLQLARAYAMAGDKTKARSAYQDFFRLWKDADPDVPVLQQARAEYGKLQ